MSYPTQEQMHEQHVTWRNERALWLAQVNAWRAKEEAALADLARLKAAVLEHAGDLHTHAASIRALAEHVREHEHGIAELQLAGAGEQWDPSTPDHEQCVQCHDQLRAAHELLRHRQTRFLHRLVDHLARIRDEVIALHRQ